MVTQPLCSQYCAKSSPAHLACAISFSWCGNTRSSPPQWMSNAAPEVELGHRRAFEVPARTAAAPRRRPRRLARLLGLPQREVARDRACLRPRSRPGARRRACARTALPYSRVAADVEVDVPARGVRVAVVDEALHHLDHLRDVAGGPRLDGRRQHAQLVDRPSEGPLERRGPLPPRPARLGGLVQDLVFDVRDVADERDVVVVGEQPAPQHVECDAAAYVADMGVALHRGATQVHRCVSRGQRNEVTQGPRLGVE